MHDELDCITRAVGMYRAILDEADDKAWCRDSQTDPEAEIRTRLPWMLGRLSPESRAAMACHLDHVTELVAFVHRTEAHQGAEV